MRNSSWLLLAALVCGCASRPPHTSQAPPVQARNEPPVVATATAGAAQPGVNQDLVKRGYKAVSRRGEMVYCRKDAVTGTAFRTNVCLTEFQITDMERRAHEEMQVTPSSCAGTGCR